jgi:hypothetical protein
MLSPVPRSCHSATRGSPLTVFFVAWRVYPKSQSCARPFRSAVSQTTARCMLLPHVCPTPHGMGSWDHLCAGCSESSSRPTTHHHCHHQLWTIASSKSDKSPCGLCSLRRILHRASSVQRSTKSDSLSRLYMSNISHFGRTKQTRHSHCFNVLQHYSRQAVGSLLRANE